MFAIASLQTVHVYDTSCTRPYAVIQGLHCAEITDLAWSNDGTNIVVSSRDGFCSLIKFAKGEFGVRVDGADLPLCMCPAKERPAAVSQPSQPAMAQQLLQGHALGSDATGTKVVSMVKPGGDHDETTADNTILVNVTTPPKLAENGDNACDVPMAAAAAGGAPTVECVAQTANVGIGTTAQEDGIHAVPNTEASPDVASLPRTPPPHELAQRCVL